MNTMGCAYLTHAIQNTISEYAAAASQACQRKNEMSGSAITIAVIHSLILIPPLPAMPVLLLQQSSPPDMAATPPSAPLQLYARPVHNYARQPLSHFFSKNPPDASPEECRSPISDQSGNHSVSRTHCTAAPPTLPAARWPDS